MKRIFGTGAALITPFNEKNKIDYKSLEKLVTHINIGSVDYLVLLGSTSEPSSLKSKEKNNIIDFIQSINHHDLPIILSIGGNNTECIIEQIKNIKDSNFEAILSVSPYYNRPSQEGIYQHFKKIAESIQKNIVLYNVPSRTGSNILPETVLRLAQEYGNIIGIKEASGRLFQSYELINNKPKEFSVISGDDALALPITLSGGEGVISVLAQAIPQIFSNMIDNSYDNKINKVFESYYHIYNLINSLSKEVNPTGIKYFLKLLTICKLYVRLPLIKASKELKVKIKTLYNRYIEITSILY
ncbi:dihydrodipicolinate synthase [Candidatus Uzinura diaspidicola str. ASNER]|uniref:4-hydroxy-tetrahydrodipicolinate synthase n=1 Tax=Candidatus Uzinura diaspidicola str. ASNER TaxID=1133592 RepID=L7VK36_9FLAO|nr:dihydrodipicolinate synthase [Candidatus Uzinura diaspidicola str. ASNER]